MPTTRESQFELARLVRRIQDLTLYVQELRKQRGANPELEARTEPSISSWRLATVARSTATNDLDAAA